MTRTLTILAAIATLAVSAAPVASASAAGDRPTESVSYVKAGPSKQPPRALGAADDISHLSSRTVASAGSWKKPPSQAVDVKRGLAAAFEDGDELFETVYVGKAQPEPRGNGIIAVLIGAVGVKDGTSNTVLFAERSSGNAVQGVLYNGHAGLGANAAEAPQSGTAGAAAAASQGIIMRDGGICDPIRHMGC